MTHGKLEEFELNAMQSHQQAWILVSALLSPSCETFSKLFNLFEPQFLKISCALVSENKVYLRQLWGLHELIYLKCLEKGPVQSKCHVNPNFKNDPCSPSVYNTLPYECTLFLSFLFWQSSLLPHGCKDPFPSLQSSLLSLPIILHSSLLFKY